jgi:hypothetical protein
MDAPTLATTLREATNMLPLLILLMWNCLRRSPGYYKAPVYDQVFPTLQILQAMMNDWNFSFASGLFDALRSSTPPSLAFFKSLPSGMHAHIFFSVLKNVFAVYVVVMEKAGKWKIYIGSATNSIDGLLGRARNYKNHDSNLGTWVLKALAEGWTITHIGLLAWLPLPRLRDQARIRALFLIMEATFTWTFWSMNADHSKIYYGMDVLCPWKLLDLEYQGLNSSSCLRETPVSDFELSARQLDTLEVVRTFTRQDHIADWRNKKRDEDPVAYHQSRALERQKERQKAKEKDAVAYKASYTEPRNRAKAEGKYPCHTCGTVYGTKAVMDRHFGTQKHKMEVRRKAKLASLGF